MRYLQIAAALILPFVMTGCWQEQQQAMNACVAQFPYKGKWPLDTRVKTPIVMCMEKAGYVRDFHNSLCVTQAVPRRNVYCYRPEGFFAAVGYRIEMFGNSGPKPPKVDADGP